MGSDEKRARNTAAMAFLSKGEGEVQASRIRKTRREQKESAYGGEPQFKPLQNFKNIESV